MINPNSQKPIGVFDSGIGGLSVLRAIKKELPDELLIYLADQAHVPYGPRSLEEVRNFSTAITEYLLRQNCKLIVLACNTASAASLHYLRNEFPEVPFVGMEPAVKPAAEISASKIVGVLATPATFQGELYASVVERFANGVKILQNTCPGLVDQIETGDFDSQQTRQILEAALSPMLIQGIDTIVLGCTHYPFVIPVINEIAGPQVNVIDPAPAVARQVRRLMDLYHLRYQPDNENATQYSIDSQVRYLTTAHPDRLQKAIQKIFNQNTTVEKIHWSKENLLSQSPL